MELSDYINLTLTEIAEGVRKVNESYEITREGGYVLDGTSNDVNGVPYTWIKSGNETIRKPIINVTFRVGVEIEETKEKGGQFGGSLKVISANTEVTKKDGTKSVQEITFEVPLILHGKR